MTTKDEIFAAENAGESKEHLSPAGKYRLVVTTYQTGEGYWNYTQGKVYRGEKCLAEVRRNYHQFPFTFIEGHKNGHDYLVCGEDYQGQTVIELDTGERVDYRPAAAKKGHGFCWAYYKPSPDGTLMAVNGCIWACPYENHVYDFAEPMKPPCPGSSRAGTGRRTRSAGSTTTPARSPAASTFASPTANAPST